MPYIPQEQRDILSDPARKPITSGQLNYLVSTLCSSYIGMRGVSYTTLNEVIGVLECAKLELYRRILSPYEDTKIAQHGEVYTSIINPKAD